MAHKHGVYDTDPHFSIDKYTRSIVDTSNVSKVIKQGDHNSERFSFDLPRYIDEHDMSLCDSVNIHFINTDGTNVSKSVYEVSDLRASSDDEVVFTWLISREATMYAGTLSFAISFECVTGGVVDYSWSAGINSDVVIGENINNGEVVVSQYVDILAQWKQELIDSGVEGVNIVDKALSDALAAFNASAEAKGAAVLASIPEDYTELNNQVELNTRYSAPVIKQAAEGESIVVNDSANMLVLGLNVYGKSTQDGEPSPDNPKEILSVDGSFISVTGKNLLKNDIVSHTTKGLEVTVNEDKSVTINGTATSLAKIHFLVPSGLIAGEEYILSGCPSGGETATYSLWVDNTGAVVDNGTGVKFTHNEAVIANPCIRIAANATINNLTFKPMIRLANADDSTYEPYIGCLIETKDVLAGIPVESNGNYTDSEGQQWVCDEIDFERGVYIQRVLETTLNGTEYFEDFISEYDTVTLAIPHKDWSPLYCTHAKQGAVDWANSSRIKFYASNFKATNLEEFKAFVTSEYENGNPIKILSILAKSNETFLSAEELLAYKELYMNYPVTTVVNDSGAHMKLVYAADTKTYIDNKFAELSALISNNA